MAVVGDVGDDVIFLAGGAAFLHRPVLLQHAGFLCGEGIGLHLYLVIGDLVFLAHREVDLGGMGNVEDEGEVVTGLPGDLGLLLCGQGLANHGGGEAFGFHKVVKGLRQGAVHGFIEGLLAIEALDERERSHSAAETADIGLAFVFIQALVEGLFIIGIGNLDGYFQVQVVDLLLRNVHYNIY